MPSWWERHVGVAGVVDDVDLEGVVRCLVGRLLFVWSRSLAATMTGAVYRRSFPVGLPVAAVRGRIHARSFCRGRSR